ncbi:hypothetical protein Cha6605_2272 [Chamaesiphon minutus PCC 6605]|uniref:Uncharacterized protein n=1 Tax=Chamaesiphon minutus (strain ATCC 27169 / PCC 6605) TaxID=1173020 RepID=K9UEW4_CHAP6|nr:hypothetical protein Cha6605_2272 [Chamaesiphon minutus PCC 6605]
MEGIAVVGTVAADGVVAITELGKLVAVAVTPGEVETVGVGVITGAGDCGTDDVGRVRVQAVNAIVPIPISNLKYLTLDLN